MHEFITAALIAAAIYCYWILCRKRSLEKRRVAARLLSELESKSDVPEARKDKAFDFYRLFSRWHALPMMTFLGFPFVIYGVLSGEMASHTAKKKPVEDDAMNASWQMYVARNPITTVICLTFMSTVIAIMTPFAVLMNKVRLIPAVADVVRNAYESSDRHRHSRPR